MAQTTGGTSLRNLKVEYSLNGSSWTDMSGFSNEIDPGEGERKTDEETTFDGDVPIVTAGKRAAVQVKCNFIYTEGGSDVAEVVRAAFEAASPFYLRYSPKGQSTGTFLWTTTAGIVKNFKYPGGSSNDAKPVLLGFTLHAPSIVKSVNA